MSAYEANIYKPDSKLNHNNQTVIITFDIKNIMLITNAIYTIAGLLYICKTRPFTFLTVETQS
jgi:hypothetical protein